jgi:hypothetical protein
LLQEDFRWPHCCFDQSCYLNVGNLQIGPVKEFSRNKKPGAANKGTRATEDEGSKRKASLRLGTSRKGRAAEVLNRRGSLKRRDRRAEKEARLEAAIERKTVVLPEYVICSFFTQS